MQKEKQKLLEEAKRKKEETNEDVDLPDLRTTPKDIALAFLAAIRSPIVIGNVAGIIWSAIGVKPPIWLHDFTKFYGSCVGYLALIGLGRFIHKNSFVNCKWWILVFCLVVRFIIYPVVSLLFCLAFKLEGRLARQCIVLAMLPTANSAFILADSTGCGPGVLSSMILWGLICIVPVILIWMAIINKFNLFPDDLSDIVIQ